MTSKQRRVVYRQLVQSGPAGGGDRSTVGAPIGNIVLNAGAILARYKTAMRTHWPNARAAPGSWKDLL